MNFGTRLRGGAKSRDWGVFVSPVLDVACDFLSRRKVWSLGGGVLRKSVILGAELRARWEHGSCSGVWDCVY